MRILISKLNHLGDAVSFLPTLKGLEESYPEAHFTVLCTPVSRAVFHGCLKANDWLVVEPQAIRGWQALRTVARKWVEARGEVRPEISVHSHDEPSFSFLLAWALGARRRIGFRGGQAALSALLTERLAFDTVRNVVELNFDLVRYMRGEPNLVAPRVALRYSDADRKKVDGLLLAIGIVERTSFVAIHPKSKEPYKEWCLERYLSVAHEIEARFGFRVLLVSEHGNDVAGKWKSAVSGLSVNQLAYLLERACVFIGNNSGPMHIASAMGTPCIIIQGPSPSNWEIAWKDTPNVILKALHLKCLPCERFGAAPPGLCTNRAAPNACMKEISVNDVMAAFTRLTERHGIQQKN